MRGRRGCDRRGAGRKPSLSYSQTILAAPGITRWWDAGKTVGVTGGLVDTWTDRVAGEALANTLTGRPTFVASSALYGNLPTVDFGTANTELISTPSTLAALLISGQAHTIYTVARRNTLVAGAGADFWFSSGTLASTTTEYSLGTTNSGAANADRIEINAATPGAGNDWGTATRYYTVQSDASGFFKSWISGVASVNNAGASPLPTGTDYLLVGGGRRFSASNAGFDWRGEIAEIVVYLALHSTAQRQTIEAAMKRKYAL